MKRIRVDSGVYHCISRANGRLKLLDRPEVKEQFTAMLERISSFCAMEMLSFCVMGNHFHVLVRETKVASETFDDQAFHEKLLLLYGSDKGRIHFEYQQAFRKGGNDIRADEIRERYRRMMGDVSWFMRLLKQRFSVWYNRSYGREGTLWSGRFLSVAVEDSDAAIRTMAAYIDLNPVRAGLANDPRDYRWSTIGAASGGVPFGQQAICRVYAIAVVAAQDIATWDDADVWWRGQLAEAAGAVVDENGTLIRQGMSDQARKQLSSGQSRDALLMRRLKFLVAGAAIGSEAYIRGIVERERGRILPSNRRSEGSKLPGDKKNGLFSLRNTSE